MSSFDDLVSVDEEDLKQALSLEIDDYGNFYDPLAKDFDNDGIPDRYNNYFRYSDYFETTYDVEDNFYAREESKEKVSEKQSSHISQKKNKQKHEKINQKNTKNVKGLISSSFSILVENMDEYYELQRNKKYTRTYGK